MKKNIRWIALIGGLAVLCVVALVILMYVRKPGSTVYISQDGQVVKELPLNEDTEITIPGPNGGYNIVVIQNGQVSVTEASCPDQVCVKHVPISHTVDRIVCLPNKLVVQVETDKNSDLNMVE